LFKSRVDAAQVNENKEKQNTVRIRKKYLALIFFIP